MYSLLVSFIYDGKRAIPRRGEGRQQDLVSQTCSRFQPMIMS